MNVIGYVRVSTADQTRSGLGVAAQREAIQAEADRRGWDVEWIEDSASGSTLQRPGIRAALERLEEGGPKVLVAAKLDRVARSALDFLTLVDRSQREGWQIVVLDLGLDTSTPMGQFTATVMAGVAELERRLISQRTVEALAQAKRRGTRLGRPVSTPEPVRRRIAEERAAGASMQQIADRLTSEGVPTARGGQRWHSSTVKAVLDSMGRDQESAAAKNQQ